MKTTASGTTPQRRRLGHLHRDRGYRFANRDPVLEEVTRLITDSGFSLSVIATRAQISVSTLSNWCNGMTKHPYNDRVDAVLLALGYRRTVRAAHTTRKEPK
jgi:hypothetical protein